MAETIYWSKNAVATVGPSGETNFDDAREAAESTSNTNNTTSSNIQSTRFGIFTGRGSTTFGFGRAYLAFNLSSYTTGTITNLKFHWKPTTSTSFGSSHYLTKFTGFGSNTNFSNYAPASWWDDISLAAANRYAGPFTIADSTAASSTTLTSQAVTDAQSDGYLQMVLMTTSDYNGLNSGVATDMRMYLNWGSNTTGNVYLQFDYAAPPSGYGNKINAVTANASNKINAVIYSSINKVNNAE